MLSVNINKEPSIGINISPSAREWFVQAQKDGTLAPLAQLRDTLQHDLEAIFRHFGGPQQFLQTAVTSGNNHQVFAARLDQLHSEAGTFWDGRRESLADGQGHFFAKISSISFSTESTVKPPTFQKVALQLVDEFALNGFLSQGEPVQVWLPTAAPDGGAIHTALG